jgi:O-antigen/teichoic acid export membrane protein
MRSGRISRNTAINMAGAVLPLLLTLFTVPRYLRLIGDIRFGVLAMVWLLLSYFAIFDMGLGRATSRSLAQLKAATGAERASVFWTALLINSAFGLIGGLALWIVTLFFLGVWLNVPDTLKPEFFSALPWLAAAVPVATNLSVMIGALEGSERFMVVNTMQVLSAAAFQLCPLAVAVWRGPDLRWLIASAVLARIVSSLPLFTACWKFIPLTGAPRVNWQKSRELFSFGGWITISGLLTPLMATLDRLLVGAMRGAQAVTYYTVPCNFATKFSMVPASLSRTLFPRFSMQTAAQQQELARRSLLALAALLTCGVAITIPLVNPFFRLWIGPELAARSSHIGELLLVGIWVNGLSWIPSAQLQARGRPDLVAKFHALEFVPFLLALWAGLKYGGVQGAAIVWVLRVIVDTALLLTAAGLVKRTIASILTAFSIVLFSAVLVRFAGDSLTARATLAVTVLAMGLGWTAVFVRSTLPHRIRFFRPLQANIEDTI